MAGPPLGNDNAHKGKPFKAALKRALSRSDGSVDAGLIRIANQLLKAANNGEAWALKEVMDRIDGKPAQQQIVTGNEDGPVQISVSTGIDRD